MNMTPEQALIAQAGHQMLAARAGGLITAEVKKGCNRQIHPDCVALEPLFSPILFDKNMTKTEKNPDFVYEPPPTYDDITRIQVWMSPEHELNWNNCELFLKQLLSMPHRLGLEIIGNCSNICITLLCHKEDVPLVTTSFNSQIEHCQLSAIKDDLMTNLTDSAKKGIMFFDYVPPPPYSHLLTRPNELKTSPYNCLFTAMSSIPSSSTGFFQVLFQPVAPEHNWHRNVELLLDIEYIGKLVGSTGAIQRYPQQAPSGDLHQMSSDVENKAHKDKPLFATALRVAIMGNDNDHGHIRSLDLFGNLFQHGGRPLDRLCENDYLQILNPEQLQSIFLLGLTYRPGFLVNSSELSGFFHFPPSAAIKELNCPFSFLEPISDCKEMMIGGTEIGKCNVAGVDKQIFIPETPRMHHTHIIGSTGMGKSILEQHMILDDIRKGHGVAVLDPHGDSIERLLYHIPKELIDKVIYFDPGDPDWIPIWNPLQMIPGQDIGRMADNLIGVIKSFVTGWGDRMENILRHGIFALLHFQESTMQDLADIISKNNENGERLRKLILKVIDNEEARKFWQEDFVKFRADELLPPRNKLSKLLVSGTVSKMLAQPKSFFNFRNIMDTGMIFLANLSKLGSEVRMILGGFMLAIIYMTALSREMIRDDKRKTFHVFLDEAQLFVTDSLEEMIEETRKFGVYLTLAHQYMSQFKTSKTDAISTVGTTIAFKTDTKDAAFLGKNFTKKVKLDDFIDLELGQAIVRSGTQTARIRTLGPIEIPNLNYRDEIIKLSRQKYCRTLPQIREMIKQQRERYNQPATPLVPPPPNPQDGSVIGEFIYDELHE